MSINVTILRLCLTAILLVPVYKETGVWTVVTIALIAFAIEIESLILRMLLKAVKSISAASTTIRRDK